MRGNHRSNHLFQCAIATALWLPAVALAHGLQTLTPVEVIGNGEAAAGLSDSASEGTVRGLRLQARPLARPGELLETTPGLIVTQHSGEGKANQYFLRGYNLDHGTDLGIFVDGMPINMPTHGHGQGYADLGFLIPELVTRSDYHKGPYFAENGDFSSAGSVRLTLPDRLDSNSALVSFGQRGYRRALLAGSPGATAFAGHNVLYALEAVATDGPWTRPDELRKLNGILRFGEGTAQNGYSITAMAYRANWYATDQIPARAIAAGTLGRFDSLDTTDGGRARRYSLSGDWRRSVSDCAWHANAYAIASDLALFSNFTYALRDPVNGDQFAQRDRRTLGGGHLARSWDSKWGGRDVENTVGLQLRADQIRLGLFNTVARDRLATVRDDRVRQESLGLYLQNRIAWTSNVRTVAGARIDSVRASVASDRSDNSGSARDRLISPKLALILGPWAKTEFYASAGQGFHSNDARGATITTDPASGARAERVPFLVRQRGAEVGVRSTPLTGWTSTLALFGLDSASELVFAGDAGTTEASRATRRTGVELTNRYTARSWLLVDVDFAQTRSRFRDVDPAGRDVPGAPARIASASVTIDPIPHWYGTLQLRHFGARPLIEDGSVRSNATTLVSGKIGYQFGKWLRVQLDAFNLQNRKSNQIDYYYESRLRGESTAVADRHFHPVEPRSVRLALIGSY